ncbi:class I SAM-dependent methyltransferase [Kordiimonas aestuarii]|uniref:class I SAM-dependent methyltransferase n=1 Tax=Kordiimonas aestuarii TaxID=1005925 RepID=UPI0021CFB2E9|nr:class I SAM-dependent methyltransferase [Kordiimonas aestuarii]
MSLFKTPEDAIRAYKRIAADNVPGGGLGDENVRLWAALFELQRQNGTKGGALEIGVWHGFSASYICGHLSADEELVLVDKFMREQHFRPTFNKLLGEVDTPIRFFPDDSFELKKDGRLTPCQDKLRFVHIDGEHSREAVENDLELVDGLLQDDGIVVVDDMLYFHTPQVSHGLFSYINRSACQLKPFLFAFNKCYLARPDAHANYRDFAVTVIDQLEDDTHKYNCAFSHRRLDPAYVGISAREYGLPKYSFVNIGFDDLPSLQAYARENIEE